MPPPPKRSVSGLVLVSEPETVSVPLAACEKLCVDDAVPARIMGAEIVFVPVILLALIADVPTASLDPSVVSESTAPPKFERV